MRRGLSNAASGNLPHALNITSYLDLRYGGICASMPGFSQALQRTGRWRVTTAVFAGADEVSPFGPGDGALARFPRGRKRWFTDGSLKKELRTMVESADLVHIHGLWEEHTAVGSSLARAAGKPYVISSHGMLDSWAVHEKRWKKAIYAALIERGNLRGAACLRAVTPGEVDDYGAFGVGAGPFAVLPLGVDPPMTESPEPFLERFPELRGVPLVVFLGRIQYKKGPDLLARAFAAVKRDVPEAKLVFAGPESADTQPQLLRLINELGIGGSVVFTGMVVGEMKWSLLAAATVFVLPSHSENFAVSISEAMAAARPVIATRQCNRPEVGASGAGVLIEPDSAQLEKELRNILTLSGERLRVMGEMGTRLVRERYTWEAIGTETANLYDWLVGNGVEPACVAGAPVPGTARNGGGSK